jgi:hypothetical protein
MTVLHLLERTGGEYAWSSVNNCTGPQRRRLELELKTRGFVGGEHDIQLLLKGRSIDGGGGMRLFYRDGRLQEKSWASGRELSH